MNSRTVICVANAMWVTESNKTYISTYVVVPNIDASNVKQDGGSCLHLLYLVSSSYYAIYSPIK